MIPIPPACPGCDERAFPGRGETRTPRLRRRRKLTAFKHMLARSCRPRSGSTLRMSNIRAILFETINGWKSSDQSFRSSSNLYTGTRAAFRSPHAQVAFSMARVPCLQFQKTLDLKNVLQSLPACRRSKRPRNTDEYAARGSGRNCTWSASSLLRVGRVKRAGKGFSGRSMSRRRCRFFGTRCLLTWHCTVGPAARFSYCRTGKCTGVNTASHFCR